MSNRKPEHYTYTALGKTNIAYEGAAVTRDADGAALGVLYRVNRLGGGHMWQARPVGAVPGEERITFQPTKLAGAVYLDAIARVQAHTYAVGDEVLYDAGMYNKKAFVMEGDAGPGRILVGGASRPWIRIKDIALAMMKNPLPPLTPNTPEA